MLTSGSLCAQWRLNPPRHSRHNNCGRIYTRFLDTWYMSFSVIPSSMIYVGYCAFSFRWPDSRFQHSPPRRATIYSSAFSDSIALRVPPVILVLSRSLVAPRYFMSSATYDLQSVAATNDRRHRGSQGNRVFQGGHDAFRCLKRRTAVAVLRIEIGAAINPSNVELWFIFILETKFQSFIYIYII